MEHRQEGCSVEKTKKPPEKKPWGLREGGRHIGMRSVRQDDCRSSS